MLTRANKLPATKPTPLLTSAPLARSTLIAPNQQVPQIRPEPYHGSANNAASAALGSSYYQQQVSAPFGLGPAAVAATGSQLSGSRMYEQILGANPNMAAVYGGGISGIGGNLFGAYPPMGAYQPTTSSAMVRPFGYSPAATAAATSGPNLGASRALARGLIGGPSLLPNAGGQGLPYALVPAPSTGLLPFGKQF